MFSSNSESIGLEMGELFSQHVPKHGEKVCFLCITASLTGGKACGWMVYTPTRMGKTIPVP